MSVVLPHHWIILPESSAPCWWLAWFQQCLSWGQCWCPHGQQFFGYYGLLPPYLPPIHGYGNKFRCYPEEEGCSSGEQGLSASSAARVLDRCFRKKLSIILNSRLDSFPGPSLHLFYPLHYITGELWSKITSSLGPKSEIIAGRGRGGHLTLDAFRASIGGSALGGVLGDKLGSSSLAAPMSFRPGAGQYVPLESVSFTCLLSCGQLVIIPNDIH